MLEDGNALQLARDYLDACVELKDALGIGEDAELIPHSLGEGEHNLNFWFEDPGSHAKYVLRINVLPQPFHKDQVRYEFEALRAVEPSGQTPIPIFCDHSKSAPAEGALVISFCEGAQLDFDAVSEQDLWRVANIMADIHAVSVPVADALDAPSAASHLFRPRDAMVDLFHECVERFELYEASEYRNARITQWAQRYITLAEKVLAKMPSPDDDRHIINTEPLASHFLLPEGSEAAATSRSVGLPTGYFVDWERSILGEVAQDVAFFTSPAVSFWDSGYVFEGVLGKQFVDMYWETVANRFERGNFDARYVGYRIMTALRSVTWCCKALIRYGALSDDGTRIIANTKTATEQHRTDKTIEKLPIYLSDDFMQMLFDDCLAQCKLL